MAAVLNRYQSCPGLCYEWLAEYSLGLDTIIRKIEALQNGADRDGD